MSGGANFAQGAHIFPKSQITKIAGRSFYMKISRRFAPDFIDFTSENSSNLEFSVTEIAYFSALRAQNARGR